MMHNRKKVKQKKVRKRLGKTLKLVFQLVFLFILILIVAAMAYFYHKYGKTILALQADAKIIVRGSSPSSFQATKTSLVYDADGEVIAKLRAEKDVYYIEYKDIPSDVIQVMLVTEDRKFLEHDGVDYFANIRAAIALIKNKGVITQGASTITQQLARNVFLSHQVSYERKIEEIFIAQELEKRYNKYQIMEYYLNNIYFANGYYGIQSAANGYFGKSVTQLSLSQIAFLCAIPNNPTIYNPHTKMENTLKRRDRILQQLLDEEKISDLDFQEAKRERIELQQTKLQKYNYVETYVKHSAIMALMHHKGFQFRNTFESEEDKQSYEDVYYDLYYSCQKDLFVSGYRIYTSIDMKKQELLQEAVDQALEKFEEVNDEGIYQLQGAAVSIDNDNGKVVAIVGGRSQDLKGYTINRGYQSYRQPGSAIKPLIVYTPAFERDYIPDSIVYDERFEGGPRNSGGNYSGRMKLQRAIETSKNTIAWSLFEELTPTVGLTYLLRMNFAKISERDYYPAASLGGFTIGVSPLEMAAAYSTIENDGVFREPTCIVKIMDAKGNVIIEDTEITKEIYQSNAARIMTEALTGVLLNGTAKGRGLKYTESAGKTGTTDNRKDGWFVGYTPYYTTSVWVGYDIPRRVEGLSGSSYPLTIWHNYMSQIHSSTMKNTFATFDWRSLQEQLIETDEDDTPLEAEDDTNGESDKDKIEEINEIQENLNTKIKKKDKDTEKNRNIKPSPEDVSSETNDQDEYEEEEAFDDFDEEDIDDYNTEEEDYEGDYEEDYEVDYEDN